MNQYFLTINSWMGQGLFGGGLGRFLWGMVSGAVQPLSSSAMQLDRIN